MKGRALRRALKTTEAIHRIGGDIPLLTDKTELITPERAYELLDKNLSNRPINWNRVETYAKVMRDGAWKVHGQGLMFDSTGKLLTGQHRLWAVIYADRAVPMRISYGNPPEVATFIDRGIPQSARDLSTRSTGRKHSPVEASIARAMLAYRGLLKPSVDSVSEEINAKTERMREMLLATKGTRKTKSVIMILAAIGLGEMSRETWEDKLAHVERYSTSLDTKLAPSSASSCWGRGAAFHLAMKCAYDIVA